MYNYYPMVSFLYQYTNKTFHFASGSKDVITWMNRYGHTISSGEVNLVKTNAAETQASVLSRTFVPRIMQPSAFVTCVFDNCDHNLESKFKLTMHCTSGTVMQKCQNTDNRILTHNPILQQAESRKGQSFNLTQQDLAPFIKQPRSEPTKFDVVDININLFYILLMMYTMSFIYQLLQNHQQSLQLFKKYYFSVRQKLRFWALQKPI